MAVIRGSLILGVLLLLANGSVWAAPLKPGHHPKANVTEPTRLDWTFVLSSRSQTKLPPDWLPDYDSTKQTFELFLPTRREKGPMPALIYIAPSDEPNALKHFGNVAKARGFLLAAPRGVGNSTPSPKRVRIVMDVFDQLRRDYAIDPDRTYIAGFSGGGRVAGAIAFALPELCGGVMPIGAGGFLREESWLRQRVGDRLRVALLTGETDFNRGEVERLRAPYLKVVGVENKVWMQKGLGHTIPEERIIGEAVAWLEAGLKKRQTLAKNYPASRLAADADVSRETLAKALFSEGQARLTAESSRYAGLMQIKGVLDRWPDTGSGKQARTILLEHEEKKQRPWEADDVAEQRKFLLALARGTDGYASGPLAKQYAKMRPDMIRQAISYWEKLVEDMPEGEVAEEGKKRIAALRKLAEK